MKIYRLFDSVCCALCWCCVELCLVLCSAAQHIVVIFRKIVRFLVDISEFCLPLFGLKQRNGKDPEQSIMLWENAKTLRRDQLLELNMRRYYEMSGLCVNKNNMYFL